MATSATNFSKRDVKSYLVRLQNFKDLCNFCIITKKNIYDFITKYCYLGLIGNWLYTLGKYHY